MSDSQSFRFCGQAPYTGIFALVGAWCPEVLIQLIGEGEPGSTEAFLGNEWGWLRNHSAAASMCLMQEAELFLGYSRCDTCTLGPAPGEG